MKSFHYQKGVIHTGSCNYKNMWKYKLREHIKDDYLITVQAMPTNRQKHTSHSQMLLIMEF